MYMEICTDKKQANKKGGSENKHASKLTKETKTIHVCAGAHAHAHAHTHMHTYTVTHTHQN